MINTEINSANRETTTPLYGNLAKSLEEIQDLGLEEYFRDFANTEMSAFLEIIPKPLTRRLEPKRYYNGRFKSSEISIQTVMIHNQP